MDDSLGVGRCKSGEHLGDDRDRLVHLQLRPLGEQFGQRLAGDVLHREKQMARVLADEVDMHDIRVRDAGRHGGFGAESPHKIRVVGKRVGQHFDRHFAVQFPFVAAEHVSHPAAADATDDLVVCQFRKRQRRGLRRLPRHRPAGRVWPLLVTGQTRRGVGIVGGLGREHSGGAEPFG